MNTVLNSREEALDRGKLINLDDEALDAGLPLDLAITLPAHKHCLEDRNDSAIRDLLKGVEMAAVVAFIAHQQRPLDIWLVNSEGDDNQVRRWAMAHGIDAKLVSEHSITLNHDAGRWLLLEQSKIPVALERNPRFGAGRCGITDSGRRTHPDARQTR